MNRKLSWRWFTVILVVLSMAFVTPVPSTSAAPTVKAAWAPVPGCVTNVGYTIKAGNTIKGSGSMACQNLGLRVTMKLVVDLQVHRWWGWQTIDTEKRGFSPTPKNWALGVAATCKHGRYTYRTVVHGYVQTLIGPGKWNSYSITKISNLIRVRC